MVREFPDIEPQTAHYVSETCGVGYIVKKSRWSHGWAGPEATHVGRDVGNKALPCPWRNIGNTPGWLGEIMKVLEKFKEEIE